MEPDQPNTLEPRKRPLHTIIPAFMEKGDVRIGFGIMGGWNQAQAHAQYVANIVDYGMNIQEALEAGRFTKGSFDGCDLRMESWIPEAVREELGALGHEIRRYPTSHRGLRFRSGSDERWYRRPLRGFRAEARWSGDSAGPAGLLGEEVDSYL